MTARLTLEAHTLTLNGRTSLVTGLRYATFRGKPMGGLGTGVHHRAGAARWTRATFPAGDRGGVEGAQNRHRTCPSSMMNAHRMMASHSAAPVAC